MKQLYYPYFRTVLPPLYSRMTCLMSLGHAAMIFHHAHYSSQVNWHGTCMSTGWHPIDSINHLMLNRDSGKDPVPAENMESMAKDRKVWTELVRL